MGVEQRVRQLCRAVVLPLVLVVGITWAALLGLGRSEQVPAGEVPHLAISTLAAQPVMPVVPDAHSGGKASKAALLVFVATIVALLFGAGRRVRWPAASARGSAATASLLVHTVRGRAPPRLAA
jgi:hypothetical protein